MHARFHDDCALPFLREAGAGSGVVCLHSNASTSSQWRALIDELSPRFHVLAPDSSGTGQPPTWPSDRPLSLHDEVALLEPVFSRAGDPFALVGHSYGAAVALVAAVAQPHSVRALALYKPTLFSLLDAESPPRTRPTGSEPPWLRPGRPRCRRAGPRHRMLYRLLD